MSFSCQNADCANFQRDDIGTLVKNGRDRQQRQRYRCKTCGRTLTVSDESAALRRKPHQNKPVQSRKSERGVPELYHECKKPVAYALTPTAKGKLDEHAESLSLSASELMERLARLLSWCLVTTPRVRDYLMDKEFRDPVALLEEGLQSRQVVPMFERQRPAAIGGGDRYGLSARYQQVYRTALERDRYGLSAAFQRDQADWETVHDPMGLLRFLRSVG